MENTNIVNNNVYINSLEASEIWEHMHRNEMHRKKFISNNFACMLPNSLQLDKLKEL